MTMLTATALLAAALSAAAPEPAAAPSRPNIILIIADDLGAEDCGPFGHAKIRTPNLDRLARGGMKFTRAFLTCSSCSPSRTSMLTGRYPHATGAAELHQPVPADQVAFTEALRAAGYWTAAAGKWHLGPHMKTRFDVVNEGGGPSGCEKWLPTLKSRPEGKPFFLWLASFDPHRDYKPGAIPEPHRPEDAIIPPYMPDTPKVRADFALYYDEIARMDGFLGQVLDELDRQKIAENTLILFTTDNGRPFPRCKTTVLDSGVRTPLIARWPAKIRPGSVSGGLVSSVDFAPTFVEAAGAKPPATLQGKSFAALFADPDAPAREYAFAEHNWHDYTSHQRAVRDGRFKYVATAWTEYPLTPPADAVRSPTFVEMRQLRDEGKLTPDQMTVFNKPHPAEELYDVESDPHELRNLAADPAYAEHLARLRAALEKWKADTADRIPDPRTPDKYDRETGVVPGRPPGPKPKKGGR